MSGQEQHRGLQPLEGLCCAARCERLSDVEVEVRIGGHTSRVHMCPEHAAHHPAVRPLRVPAQPGGRPAGASRPSASR